MRALSIYVPASGGSPHTACVPNGKAVCQIRHRVPEETFYPENDGDRVLVRIEAVSCAGRDPGRVRPAAADSGGQEHWAPLGSDPAGIVVAAEKAVRHLRLGDRVLIVADTRDQGSNELQIHREKDLLRFPRTFSAEQATSLGKSALTGYALAERLRITPGQRVLVASARSNTSIAAIQRLVSVDAAVWAWTTSDRVARQLQDLGVKHTVTGPDAGVVQHTATALGGFDAIVDPLFDLHFQYLVKCLKPRGRYACCGMSCTETGEVEHGRAGEGFLWSLVNNFELHMQSFPGLETLPALLRDCSERRFRILTDSVFSGDDVDGLYQRAFYSGDRFGKVVYKYSAQPRERRRQSAERVSL